MKTILLFVFPFLFIPLNLYAQVGIGTTSPSNQLDVMGWVELGDESSTGNDVEGTIRYNGSLKCIQFYDGSSWNCIGRPKVQNFDLRDGIDETLSGNVNNIIDYNGGGYGTQYSFTVNDIQTGDIVLFLVELVVHDNLRKNAAYENSIKIWGNGIFEQKDMPGINMEETYSTYFWADDVNTSGNLSFILEVNMNMADAKITTLVFR